MRPLHIHVQVSTGGYSSIPPGPDTPSPSPLTTTESTRTVDAKLSPGPADAPPDYANNVKVRIAPSPPSLALLRSSFFLTPTISKV